MRTDLLQLSCPLLCTTFIKFDLPPSKLLLLHGATDPTPIQKMHIFCYRKWLAKMIDCKARISGENCIFLFRHRPLNERYFAPFKFFKLLIQNFCLCPRNKKYSFQLVWKNCPQNIFAYLSQCL